MLRHIPRSGRRGMRHYVSEVSDTYLRIIPTDPGYVPSALARERALSVLQRAAPFADDVGAQVSDSVRFVDCGSNFETVSCPRCGADLGVWWSEAMELGHGQHFEDLRVTLPCCGKRTSLNELIYSWPAGFARYTLEALNPGLGSLPDTVVERIEDALGSAVRIIWAHYPSRATRSAAARPISRGVRSGWSNNRGAGRMKAYCIVYEVVSDQEKFDEYRRQVPETIEKFGGRFLARGGAFDALEGDMPYDRVVILEFASRADAEAWYHSPDYQRILPLRTASTRSQFILADGVEAGA